MSFNLLDFDEERIDSIQESIKDARLNIHKCPVCQTLTDKELCQVCSDDTRNKDVLCIVEDSKIVFLFEKMGMYKGKYHVLNGLISPLDDVNPEDIVIDKLLDHLKKNDYKDKKDIIYTYCGTLFTYQYSHAWIDFRNIIDKDGIQWFDNSVKATKANRLYCIENSSKFKTYGKDSWGATACVTPQGYNLQGAQPCDVDLKAKNDGTISPCGAIGSIVFTPKESISAMEYYYNNYKKLWGKYGFKDAYNLENEKEWYSKECIGIDKGIEALMIENYLNETIWKYFMKNKYVIKGLEILGFEKINDRTNLKI